MPRPATQQRSLFDLARTFLPSLRSRFSLTAWRRRAKHRRELWALYSAEDRVLEDVGITREELKARINRSDLLL